MPPRLRDLRSKFIVGIVRGHAWSSRKGCRPTSISLGTSQRLAPSWRISAAKFEKHFTPPQVRGLPVVDGAVNSADTNPIESTNEVSKMARAHTTEMLFNDGDYFVALTDEPGVRVGIVGGILNRVVRR